MDELTTDPLEREISAKSEAISALERQLEIATAELRALQRAASLRPVIRETAGYAACKGISKGIARGKPPGAISNQWREIMGRMVEQGNAPAPPSLWSAVAGARGYPLDTKAVRDWLRRGAGAKLGLIERHGEHYKVSQAAIEKFGFVVAKLNPIPVADYATLKWAPSDEENN